MKLQLRISNCAFSVPIKPGRILDARPGTPRRERSAGLRPAATFVTRTCGFHSKRSLRSSLAAYRAALRAFTLIELLTVIAIIGILAALIAPVFKHFSKSDVSEAATRQMLDDCARARQLAISERSTVYMVFIPTNFWKDPFNKYGPNAWNNLAFPNTANMQASTVVTQMYGAQWNGYMIESLRSVGDQPGRSIPKDLVKVKTLPDGAFFSPEKFTAPLYGSGVAPFVISNYTIYGFLMASNIPFPSADVLTNPTYAGDVQKNGFGPNGFNYVTVPYIAFNYLGQLTPGDGSILPYDEYIPLAYGSILPFRDAHKANVQPPANIPPVNAAEIPPGSSTNVSYNLIHIDRMTGRARVERQDVL